MFKRNKYQVFEYLNGMQVRVVMKDDDPWFILQDVCNILSLTNVSKVASRLVISERGFGQFDTPGGKQMMTIVNESGLYAVILRSDKREALPFRVWVTSEVLPAIRKTGRYSLEDTEWQIFRNLSKLLYNVQCNAISDTAKAYNIDKRTEVRILMNEADFINDMVFKTSSKTWRLRNPEAAKKGLNQRDFATTNELLLVALMQMINFGLIKAGYDIKDRLKILKDIVPKCREGIESNKEMLEAVKKFPNVPKMLAEVEDVKPLLYGMLD